jgi:hypothetical protein
MSLSSGGPGGEAVVERADALGGDPVAAAYRLMSSPVL